MNDTENPDCACGHTLDEHERGVECTIPGCDCIHFEDVGDDEPN